MELKSTIFLLLVMFITSKLLGNLQIVLGPVPCFMVINRGISLHNKLLSLSGIDQIQVMPSHR